MKENEVEEIMMNLFDQDRQTEIFGKEQRDIGRAEGEARGVLKTAISMFKKGWISEAKAAEEAKMSISDFRKAMALL